jgi:hypothetical protein
VESEAAWKDYVFIPDSVADAAGVWRSQWSFATAVV